MRNLYKQKQFVLLLGDLLLIILATQMAFYIRLGHFSYAFKDYTGGSAITIISYLILLYIFNLYDPTDDLSWEECALRCFVAVLIACSLISFFFCYLPSWKYGRGIWIIQTTLVWFFTLLWRRIYHLYFFNIRVSTKEKALILGSAETGYLFDKWIQRATLPFQVVGYLHDGPIRVGQKTMGATLLGTTNQIFEIGKKEGVKTAVIGILEDKRPELIRNVLEAKLKGWNIRNIINDYENSTGRVPVNYIHDEWLLFAEGFYLLKKPILQKIKRLVDICLAITFLICSSPLLLLTLLAIRLDSSGPAIFRQLRAGKDGKLFELLKFRSMIFNAEKNGAIWANKHDPRITRIGRLIRFLRIDEFPQMINVLCGDMSLIGPRPERPEFISRLENEIPYYPVRYCIKPGITGWAQIKYPYGASVEDALNKLEYDLFYIKNMTLFLDIQILLKTIGVVLFGQGAQ